MIFKRRVAIRSASLTAALGLVVTLAANRTAESGDILRANISTVSQPSGGTAAGPISTTAQATAIAQRAQDSLTRATQALQAVNAMQSAARAAAIAGPNNLINPANAALNVPNGLSTTGAGGLGIRQRSSQPRCGQPGVDMGERRNSHAIRGERPDDRYREANCSRRS